MFKEFAALFSDFIHRKGFTVDLDADFFLSLQQQLPPAESLTLTLAQHNGTPVAGHLGSMLGDTCVYLLGATAEDGLKTSAAFFLQWHAITHAHSHNLRFYDLGGIDPLDNPGVYHFKQGLTGADLTAPGPFELTPPHFRASLTHHAEGIYRSLKRFRPIAPNARR